MRDPYTVIVRLSEGELGRTMMALRTWLDGEKIRPAEFKTQADREGYIFTLGFVSLDEADRFRLQFGV
jgi:hypothetical protein